MSGSLSSGGAAFELIVRLAQLQMKPEGLVISRLVNLADLIVPHQSISRRHALLVSRDGRLVVSDLGSTNGTFVDGQPARQDQPLALVRGAKVRLGEVELVVESALAGK